MEGFTHISLLENWSSLNNLKMSKTKILAAIQKNKPSGAPLPTIPSFTIGAATPNDLFVAMVEVGGGQIIRDTDPQNLNTTIKKLFPEAKRIASPLPAVESNVDLDQILSPDELESVDIAVIRGQIGVAENGAVWVTEEDCGHRVLPFITQHLIILLKPSGIVHNMHEAYERIQVDATGFGLFIAGPSKTADIEQSLVIGAQGARSLTVVLGEV